MRIVFFLLLWFSCLILQAQDTTQYIKRIDRGALFALSLSKARDEGHSPLLYRGIEVHEHWFRERWKEKRSRRLEIIAHAGMLKIPKAQTYFRTRLYTLRIEMNHHWYFKMTPSVRETQWALGPVWGNLLDFRLYPFLPNNVMSHYFNNFIGLSAAASRTVSIFKYPMQLQWRAHTSFISHTIRPNYIGMAPASTYEGASISILPIVYNYNTISFLTKSFFLKSSVMLTHERKNKKNISVQYGWQFLFDRTSNPLIAAQHELAVGYTFTKLKQKRRHSASAPKTPATSL
ncbi:MAG: hypothetical protein MUF42_04700 [Cytophagaceae bacterium]|jgi:hypothetical protein|nr:hypothetical protein [Cytophagaceae bacterium]